MIIFDKEIFIVMIYDILSETSGRSSENIAFLLSVSKAFL
jgi:hypothetical protein